MHLGPLFINEDMYSSSDKVFELAISVFSLNASPKPTDAQETVAAILPVVHPPDNRPGDVKHWWNDFDTAKPKFCEKHPF
jgi:hypothetical protein